MYHNGCLYISLSCTILACSTSFKTEIIFMKVFCLCNLASSLCLSRFLLVDSIKQTTRNLQWFSKHSQKFPDVKITDVTSHYSALSLLGPESEKVLQSLTQTSVDIKNFPLNVVKVAWAFLYNFAE